jgi:dolichol-phosphate mannosyltransferase
VPSAAFPLAAVVLALQAAAGARVLARLLPGRRRLPPVGPLVAAEDPRWAHVGAARVSVVVATLNEAGRIAPCLAGLAAQGPVAAEFLVVDSRSTDGTRAMVEAAAARDARFRLLTDAPLPDGWVGKPWALDHGRRAATGDWVLGVDADTAPRPGLVAAAVAAAEAHGLDVVSFAPRFAGQSAGERWLQPAMLATLVYRLGAPTVRPRGPGDVLANGQCFLVRREVLDRHGGYAPARASWADDVALARHLMRRGARVGFLDGRHLYDVQGYAGLRETWREWGRSFDLADASRPARQALDVATVVLAQGLPVPALVALGGLAAARPGAWGPLAVALAALNVALVGVRLGVLVATRGSYARRGAPYWLSVTADAAAAARLVLSTVRRPRSWRGRRFSLAPRAAG